MQPSISIYYYNSLLKMDEADLNQQEFMEQYDEGEEEMDFEDPYADDQDLLEIMHIKSTPQNYTTCSKQRVLQRIDSQIDRINELTGLDYGWSWMLYRKANYSMQTVYQLIQEKRKHLNVIQYIENGKIQKSNETQFCQVCYQENFVYSNVCGHKYCLNCWKSLLQVSVFKCSEILPKCQGENCNHYMNYNLIKYIIQQKINIEVKQKLQSVLIILYSRSNKQVKVCPNIRCDIKFLVDESFCSPIWCKCGTAFCSLCDCQYHFPADCAQKQNWQKLTKEKKNDWVKIVTAKICPRCKEPIEKNGGCNHMTCRCGHQFCWLCYGDWNNHACQGSKADQKMEEERLKILKQGAAYRQRFQNTEAEIQRCINYRQRIAKINITELKQQIGVLCKIVLQQLRFLQEIPQQINLGLQFSIYQHVYQFFRGKYGQEIFKANRQIVQKYLNALDQYLTDILYKIQEIKKPKNQIKTLILQRLHDKVTGQSQKQIIQATVRLKQLLVKLFERK